MIRRPPIIVVMGHVDHGKTTLLDYIRKTNVAAKEAGGITQAIGAYEIEVRLKDEPKSRESIANRGIPRQTPRDDSAASNRRITFIDTPGHEAFSKMRARGAKVADLAILVVAVDDGVMPQTKESIEILKNSETPFVIAINKIDRPNADVDKVKQQLAEIGIFLEGYGGNVSWQAISAKNGEGVNELLDLVLLAVELEDLKYDPNARTEGIILTARLDSKRGNIATAIVKNGKLEIGQSIATATAMGKVKTLENFIGEKVKKLEPSAPAIIFGFENLPQVGEEFFSGSGKMALIAEEIVQLTKEKSKTLEAAAPLTAEYIKLILRADESGSLEALEGLIEKLGVEIPLRIIDSDVGDIYEDEVKLASSTGSFIVGFKVGIDKAAENLSKSHGINIITSTVIYDLEKILKEYFVKGGFAVKGELEVLATFGERKGKQVVGGRIVKGAVKNKDSFEVWSGEEKIGEGKILNLQVQKKDVPKAETGQEAGLLVESDQPIKGGHRLIFK